MAQPRRYAEQPRQAAEQFRHEAEQSRHEAEQFRQGSADRGPDPYNHLDRPLKSGGQLALGLGLMLDLERVHIELDDRADVRSHQTAPAGPVEGPGSCDADTVTGGQVGLARSRRLELDAQPAHHPGLDRGARGQPHVERRRRVGARCAPDGANLDPRVAAKQAPQPVEPLRRALLYPHDQVVDLAGEDLLHGCQHRVLVAGARLDGDHEPRNRERPPRCGAPQPPVGYEVGDLLALLGQACPLGLAGDRPRTLVPAQGAALGREQRSEGMRPPAELDVLVPPLSERFVESAHLGEKLRGHSEVAAGHHPEDVVGARCEVVGAGHAALDPRWALRRAGCE